MRACVSTCAPARIGAICRGSIGKRPDVAVPKEPTATSIRVAWAMLSTMPIFLVGDCVAVRRQDGGIRATAARTSPAARTNKRAGPCADVHTHTPSNVPSDVPSNVPSNVPSKFPSSVPASNGSNAGVRTCIRTDSRLPGSLLPPWVLVDTGSVVGPRSEASGPLLHYTANSSAPTLEMTCSPARQY